MRASDQHSAITESRLAQAAGWQMRFRRAEVERDELSEQEFQAAALFLEDEENCRALNLAELLSSNLRRRIPVIDEAEPVDADDYDHEKMSVAEWRARGSGLPPGAESGSLSRRRLRLFYWPLAGAATITLSLIFFPALHRELLPVLHLWPFGKPVQALNTFSTGPSQTREIVLADGSHVTLGAKTTLQVQYTAKERVVILNDGEARFSVEHDALHPFTVAAGGGRITALGTQFDVRRGLDRVTVTVAEGTVLVAPDSKAPPTVKPSDAPSVAALDWQPVRLARGEKVSYDEKTDRGTIEQADLEADQGVAGRFVYRDIPIKYVIEDLNRYRSKPILLKDPAAGEREFTGTVFADRSGDWLQSLEKILPLRISEEQAGVYIESRPASRSESSSGSDATLPASSSPIQ